MRYRAHGLVWAAEGAGGGAPSGDAKSGETGQSSMSGPAGNAASPKTGDATGTGADGTGSNGGQEAGKGTQHFKAFATETEFQAEIDRLLKDRLERAAERAKADAQKAAQKAADEAAAKNGEWQQLAEQRQQRVAELEGEHANLTEQVGAQKKALARYEKALAALVAAQTEGVPEGVKALLQRLDPVEQLEWLTANREQIAGRRQGVPPTPGANGSMNEAQREAARKASDRFYSDF